MSAVILDTCGTINLYASGRFLSILRATGADWYLPSAVERETQAYRQPDPVDPEKLIVTPIDLALALNGGALKRCVCEGDEELQLYVELAARIGDDGESMGLAIAKCRGWSVLTDDRKARRIAGELGVPVLSTPEILRRWAVAINLDRLELAEVLAMIQRFANYLPGRMTVDYEWWMASLRPGTPGTGDGG